MKLFTTKDLIEVLDEFDPEGDLIVKFCIYDEEHPKDYDKVAVGEITAEDISLTMKGAQQTSEGDKDVLVISLWLDCDV